MPRRRALLVGVAGLIATGWAADYAAGRYQRQVIDDRRSLKARLDRMATRDLRTAVDDIRFDAPASYQVDFRLQNAGEEPFYVMLPVIEGYIQVGYGWQPFPVATLDGSGGIVVRLSDELATSYRADIEAEDYAVNLPGFMHVKLVLEALVSPEENPREEIGERREDIVLYLRDARQPPAFVGQPSFIPLRAWTLVPRGKG